MAFPVQDLCATSINLRPVVFIDSKVDDIDTLINGALPEAEVIVLNPKIDGVSQIASELQGRTHISAIHIVSHGTPGCLYLGNAQLNLDTLHRYANQFKTWASSRVSLFLYGCNVAAGDAGSEFVQKLHQLTGVNIAASANRIGHAAKGGNWDLEHRIGDISNSVVFQSEVYSTYSGVFTLSFEEPIRFSAKGYNPNYIATGDFNSDGKADIVLSNSNSGIYTSSGNIEVFLGTGTGSFENPMTIAEGGKPRQIVVADFNSDGNQDIAVADDNASVSVLLGNGTGSFATATNFAVADIDRGFATGIATGDFNSDGNPDLVVTNTGFNGFSVLYGTGTGSFSPATNYAIANTPMGGVAVGNFNSDNIPDLALSTPPDTVTVVLGTNTGNFESATNYTAGNINYGVPVVADFNTDGNLDIAVPSKSSTSGEVSVLLGTGTGSFATPTTYTVGTYGFRASSLAVGDYDLDGKLDIAVSNPGTENAPPGSNNLTVLLGTGTGAFTPTVINNVGVPNILTTDDFNGDGKPDLASSVFSPRGFVSGFSVLLNTSDGLPVEQVVNGSGDNTLTQNTNPLPPDFLGTEPIYGSDQFSIGATDYYSNSI
ncbi:MAG: DUF4347 domain-containing protein [Scytonema sp. PMC 1069.18]|nr:DUF4347 domain-containing protein [Scytonema sp. PMC 1069.18]MEC4887545.1 DUF4347 domain-containing protein [Scytonema sp. PMC 1070.18]